MWAHHSESRHRRPLIFILFAVHGERTESKSLDRIVQTPKNRLVVVRLFYFFLDFDLEIAIQRIKEKSRIRHILFFRAETDVITAHNSVMSGAFELYLNYMKNSIRTVNENQLVYSAVSWLWQLTFVDVLNIFDGIFCGRGMTARFAHSKQMKFSTSCLLSECSTFFVYHN